MAPIILLIVLIVFTIIITVVNALSRSFIDKKNLAFFIPILIILFFVYVTGYYEIQGKLDGLKYFECIQAAFDGFAFKIAKSIVSPLMEKNPIFKVDVFYAVGFAGLTVISGVLGFFKVGIENSFTVFFKMFKKHLDIVIGDPTMGEEYARNNKNSILWIDSNRHQFSSDERKKLYLNRVAYIYRPLTGKKMKLYTLLRKYYVQIICLQKDNKYLNDVIKLIDELDNNRKKPFRLHVQSDGELLSFIDAKLSEHCQNVNGVSANSFDVYELMSRRFANEYNLAQFLPRDFFDKGAIKPNHEINVVMLGFGKTSTALFKGLLYNNQFVEVHGKKYQAKKIQYYLYDTNQKRLDNSLLSYLYNFETYQPNADLQLCELPCEIHTECLDVKASVKKDYLNMFKAKENEFTFYVINLNKGIENASIAESLSRIVDMNRSVIFYNVDDEKEALVYANPHVRPIGFKNVILSHEYISNDTLWDLASLHNQNYNKRANIKEQSLSQRPIIEALSNAYSVINYRFKLNLLGFDYSTDDSNAISKEEFMKEYDPDNKRENIQYDDYFAISPRNAIAYQEHLRWSVFYYLNGYVQMPLKEVRFDAGSGRIVRKDIPNKKHACLANYYAMDKLVKYQFDLLPADNKNFSLVDVYNYDFQSLDNLFETIEVANYKVHKI